MKNIASIVVAAFVSLTLACNHKSNRSDTPGPSPAAGSGDEDAAFCAELTEHHEHLTVSGFTLAANKMFQVKVDWSDPLVAGELNNSAVVTVLDPHGEPLSLTISSFKLFMPAMGHGSIKGDKLVLNRREAEPNVWDASQIYFSMGGAAGEWVVDIEAGACGLSDKARVVVNTEVK